MRHVTCVVTCFKITIQFGTVIFAAEREVWYFYIVKGPELKYTKKVTKSYTLNMPLKFILNFTNISHTSKIKTFYTTIFIFTLLIGN